MAPQQLSDDQIYNETIGPKYLLSLHCDKLAVHRFLHRQFLSGKGLNIGIFVLKLFPLVGKLHSNGLFKNIGVRKRLKGLFVLRFSTEPSLTIRSSWKQKRYVTVITYFGASK